MLPALLMRFIQKHCSGQVNYIRYVTERSLQGDLPTAGALIQSSLANRRKVFPRMYTLTYNNKKYN